jgi:23S rRNA (adenine2503-C2)-methyltransferase
MQTITEIPGAPGPLEKVALETYVPPAKPSLVGLSRVEIAERLGEIGVAAAQRKMRVQQLWHWIYVRGAKDFSEMTSISKEMRAQLEVHFTVDRPEVVAEQISNDGTRKWLLRLPSGDSLEKAHEVECVYIPETDRGTLCVSSQVGCTLNCSFCHTGTQRLVRNLTAGEIVGQIMVARDRLNDWADRETPTGSRLVTNVVMMGMGEPLYNFEAVRDALLIVSDNEGIGISRRRITLSTSGVVPNIIRTGEEIGVMLAISLHAVRDELRNELVPLNRKYPIAELLQACRDYPGSSNARRITFEYVMLKGVNDSLEGASGQDQSDSIQPVAGHALRMLGLGPDREVFRIHLQRRLLLAGAHAARPRHPRRLRPAQVGNRETVGPRAPGAARHGDDRLGQTPH